jgi:uncharacterized protein YggE
VEQDKKTKLSISVDYKWLSLFLAAVIAAMLIIWKPWQSKADSGSRTIDVTGQATVKSQPDQFVFYPYYEFQNTNKDAALAQLKAKSTELVAKLKELGVEDKDIKTNSDGYDRYYFAPDSSNTPTYTLRLEITLNDKDRTQKVQDYLVSTTPKGAVSPQASFSEAKRKELESQARDEATKDARKKADQSAKNLGFNVGKVKSVSDGAGFGGVMPMYAEDSIKAVAPVADSTLPVRSGQNEISYGVSVTYFLK